MNLGVKFLLVAASLIGVSCGGYMVYKHNSDGSSGKATDAPKQSAQPDFSASNPASKATSGSQN